MKTRFLTIKVLYTGSGKGIYTMGFPVRDRDLTFYTQIEDGLDLAQINDLLSARRLDPNFGGLLIG